MLVNHTRYSFLKGATLPGGMPRASVYVCINLSGNYKECCIAGIQKDLDVAVLKVLNDEVDNNDDSGNEKDKCRGI